MEKLKYPNIEISKEGIEEYETFLRAEADLDNAKKEINKHREKLRKIRDNLIEQRAKPINRFIRIFNKNNKLDREINNIQNELYNFQKSGHDIAKERNIPIKSYAELSNDAKLYAFVQKHHADAEKLEAQGLLKQEHIDLMMNTAKEHIERYPLLVNNVDNTLPREESPVSQNTDFARDLRRAMDVKRKEKEKKKAKPRDIKHSSLTKLFKSDIKGHNEIMQTIKNCNISRDAGCLPPEWIALIPKEEIAAKTKEISGFFQEFAEKTCCEQGTVTLAMKPHIENLQKKLSKTLGTDIDISFIGNGSIGKAFKIQTGDRAVVLKTNHSQSRFIDQQSTHGNTLEVASGIYASNSDERKRFAKTYMGRVGTPEDRDTFAITRFIPQDKTKKRQNNMIKAKRVVNGDTHSENVINGIIIDMGGTQISNLMKDKEVHKLAKRLIDALPRRDGVEVFESIKKEVEKNPKMQKKLDLALEYVDKSLKHHLPDIDSCGIHQRPLREDVMNAMGVSNKVDLDDAFDWIPQYDDKQENHELKYIIESRGGIDEVMKQIKQNPSMYMPFHVAKGLVKNGAKVEDFSGLGAYEKDGRNYSDLVKFEKKIKKDKRDKRDSLRCVSVAEPKAVKTNSNSNINDTIAAARTKIATRS